MKICKKCQIEKDDNEFYTSNKTCKKCKIEYQKKLSEGNRESIKEYKKEYACKNANKISEKSKKYYIDNSEKIKERMSNYYSLNKEEKLQYQKEYATINKKKISDYKRQYQNEKRKADPIFKLKHIISRMIRGSLKAKGFLKNNRSTEILGCSIINFKKYIEEKFEGNMSWENYGIVWDIDHIIPLCTCITKEDIIRLNHYTNLQPLDSHINRNVKRDKLDYKNKPL